MHPQKEAENNQLIDQVKPMGGSELEKAVLPMINIIILLVLMLIAFIFGKETINFGF